MKELLKNNFIIIGDSITYGIGDFENCGWATLFKKFIVNKDDSKVCNNFVHIAGYPGATSTDILNRIEYIFNSFKHEEFKNIVVLSIGINDTQDYNGNFKNSIEQYKLNIKEIAKYILKENAELIVLGLTRIECDEKFLWKPNKYYDNKAISEYDNDLQLIIGFDKELKKICNNSEIKYIQMSDVLEKQDFIDGLHPNVNGHRKIFEKIINEIHWN